MGFRYICPNTGHKIDTAFEIEDDDLMPLRTQSIAMQCSFCGGSHEWVSVGTTQPDERKSRRKRLCS
jgi:hypothetical protein